MERGALIQRQFAYVIKFYPKMLVMNIRVDYRKSKWIVKTRPTFKSVFKEPGRRLYKVSFSNNTNSTLDSVLINNLTFNSQLGMIANQMSIIDDLSTGGFFNMIAYFLRSLTHSGRNKIYHEAQLTTLEAGLGYQLLSYNEEKKEKLKIENWNSTVGYSNYIGHNRRQAMSPAQISDFINDLPVYVQHQYK
jgi:hypothetical protein